MRLKKRTKVKKLTLFFLTKHYLHRLTCTGRLRVIKKREKFGAIKFLFNLELLIYVTDSCLNNCMPTSFDVIKSCLNSLLPNYAVYSTVKHSIYGI